MHNKGVSALEEVNAYVFRAGELLKLSKDFIEAFSTSERELIISIPLRRESGGIDVLTGYRIQHSSARGPRKGGIRYHQSVDLDEAIVYQGVRKFPARIKCASIAWKAFEGTLESE